MTLTGPWFVEWEYADDGHCVGPFAELDIALRHMVTVSVLHIESFNGHKLRSVTLSNDST